MEQSMKRYILLISLWTCLLVTFAQEKNSADSAYIVSLPIKSQYEVLISHDTMGISGVCLIKQVGEEWHGTFGNEFGITAFDFTISADRHHVQLLHVMSKLNKWYIKKVIRHDLEFLFEATDSSKKGRKQEIVIDQQGVIELQNHSFNISYRFSPMKDSMNSDSKIHTDLREANTHEITE